MVQKKNCPTRIWPHFIISVNAKRNKTFNWYLNNNSDNRIIASLLKINPRELWSTNYSKLVDVTKHEGTLPRSKSLVNCVPESTKSNKIGNYTLKLSRDPTRYCAMCYVNLYQLSLDSISYTRRVWFELCLYNYYRNTKSYLGPSISIDGVKLAQFKNRLSDVLRNSV